MEAQKGMFGSLKLVYSTYGTELTFDALDDQSQRFRPAHCFITSAVCYCWGRCTTEGGEVANNVVQERVLLPLGLEPRIQSI